MCYSAEFKAEYKTFLHYGGRLSIKEFAQMYGDRFDFPIYAPKAMEAWFKDIDGAEAADVRDLIARYNKQQTEKLEQEIFKQKKRLADAERTLETKTTKKALEDQRIAGNKISKAIRDLDDIKRTEPKTRDARFFPGHYVPVIVWENGQRVIKPMRYQCRLPGWNVAVERKYPGTYNARRDNLGKAWKDLFGIRHGVIVISAFYENVERHKMEHRELGSGEESENVVLEFRPRPAQDMVIACLWNESPERDGHLLSFAAITDEPAPEVAAAGHDRTIIQIKPEHIDAWLTPEARTEEALQAILSDRPEAFYEHRKAA
ncbi:MAG: SOS response-associated peptidase [Pseudomonadota bacterium]|nr:SOS response-associated peptidase [Pseudomonadota bacterium]